MVRVCCLPISSRTQMSTSMISILVDVVFSAPDVSNKSSAYDIRAVHQRFCKRKERLWHMHWFFCPDETAILLQTLPRQTVWGLAKRAWCCERIQVGLEAKIGQTWGTWACVCSFHLFSWSFLSLKFLREEKAAYGLISFELAARDMQ